MGGITWTVPLQAPGLRLGGPFVTRAGGRSAWQIDPCADN